MKIVVKNYLSSTKCITRTFIVLVMHSSTKCITITTCLRLKSSPEIYIYIYFLDVMLTFEINVINSINTALSFSTLQIFYKTFEEKFK